MPTATQTFARCSTDDADEVRPTSDFTAGVNLHLESGAVYPATGNVAVPYVLPATGDTLALGSFADGSTGTAIEFLFNSAGNHRLTRYDPSGNTGGGSRTTLLEWAGLALAEDLVLQGGILDGLLLYLDALGAIRSIDLARAAAGEYTASFLLNNPFALHLLRQPPFRLPRPVRAAGSNVVGNLVAYKSFQFAFRFLFRDGSRSVLSGYSPISFPMVSPRTGVIDPSNYIAIPIQPNVNLFYPDDAVGLEVLVREGQAAAWSVAQRIEKSAVPLPQTGEFWPNNAIFLGATTGEVLSGAETSKTFESLWPAKVLTVAKSRPIGANFRVGYPRAVPTSFTAVISPQLYQPADRVAPSSTFHELSSYQVGIQYYDEFRRPGGVAGVTPVTIPLQTVNSPFVRNIQWNVTANDATAEIPAWARYYAVCVSVNSRAQYFLQRPTHFAVGYTKAAGPYFFVTSANGQEESTWVSIGTVASVATIGGYTFQEGDILRFLDEPGQEWPILYTAVGTAKNLGGITPVTPEPAYWVAIARPAASYPYTSDQPYSGGRIEVYTPRTITGESAGFFEQTDLIPVNIAETGGVIERTYSVSGGTLKGDAYLVRPDYVTGTNPTTGPVVESPTPLAPLTPERAAWLDMSRGTAAFALPTNQGQRERKSLVAYGGVKITGTLLNGLGEWDALNQYDELPQEQGAVVRLSVADQTQQDGSVLVANQERGETSLYLGQARVQTGEGSFLTQTKDVIGGGNTLRGGFGCVDPATVTPYAGKLFWYARERNEVVRYNKGLTPLGEAGKFRRRLQALGPAYADARATGCFDPRRQEYLLTLHPAENLPGVTLVWSERREAWADAYSFVPRVGSGLGDELLTWEQGDLYRHTPDAPLCTFFGVYTPPSVTFVAAQPGALLAKTWQALGVHSLSRWVPTLLTTPTGQASRILPSWQRFLRGAWQAAIRRDENSPGFGLDRAKALHGGRVLQSASLAVTLTGPETSPGPLTACEVDFLINTGQQPNQ